MPIAERFFEKVAIIPFHDCWEWVAAKNEKGYGKFSIGTTHTNLKAHRVSWMLANGSIPDGLFVCHRCDNPGCVRPDHLFLGTPKDNMIDKVRKGRGSMTFRAGKLDPRSNGGKWNTLKTHCPSGHEYNEENTHRSAGRRRCRACSREKMRLKRAARKAQ
jgi:hypothetical protein